MTLGSMPTQIVTAAAWCVEDEQKVGLLAGGNDILDQALLYTIFRIYDFISA